MVIYIFLAVLISIPAFNKNAKGWHYVVIFVLCFLGLFRGRTVGLDVDIYCKNIIHTNFSPQSWNFYTVFEPGYNILIALYNEFFTNPLFFIGLCNVFFVLSYNRYLKYKAGETSIGIFVLYMLGYYFQSYNIIRQYFATSIMLLILSMYDFEKIKKRELVVLCVFILLVGTLFHNSIYILLSIPIYFIIRRTKLNKKIWYYAILSSSFVVFYFDIIRSILSKYSFFLINEKTNNYYYSALESNESEYSVIRILLDTLFVTYIIYTAKRNNLYLFLMVVAQTFINLFSSLNPLFARISVVPYIISIPLLVEVWKNNSKSKLVLNIYFLIIFVNTLIKNYGMVQPYVLCF